MTKHLIILLLASFTKEKEKYCQQGEVKQKVADIEKLGKKIDNKCTKIQNPQKHKINMTNIINYLLNIQIHLRYDLNCINWPSVIIGRTSQTSITDANVIIMFDE